MALTDRPKLTADEKAALLAKLNARAEKIDAWFAEHPIREPYQTDTPVPDGTPDRAIDHWQDLGAIEDDIPDPDPEGLAELLGAIGRLPAWQRDALCREPDYADLPWFPERGESTAPAKAVCERCIVADECASFAIETDAKDGVWAGANPATLRKRSAA